MTTHSSSTVFLFDVDNTLLDNDSVVADLKDYLERECSHEFREGYFATFERLRAELGYADYLGALQRYRMDHPPDTRLLEISGFLIDYPFAKRLYPQALEVVAHCKARGTPVILSDGDVVFQPHKVRRSGLWQAFEGRVLIYIHKEQMLDDVMQRYPAEHYVLVDDKLRILAAIKQAWGEKLTTVFPRQGHYALDKAANAKYPPPDITIERIGDLLQIPLDFHLEA